MHICPICGKNHHDSNVFGLNSSTKDSEINKMHRDFVVKISSGKYLTRHCMNCYKQKSGICENFQKIQDQCFQVVHGENPQQELGVRLDIYHVLAWSKGCKEDNVDLW